jgi:hypothetical protein
MSQVKKFMMVHDGTMLNKLVGNASGNKMSKE